jgi:hypothetical protein
MSDVFVFLQCVREPIGLISLLISPIKTRRSPPVDFSDFSALIMRI